MGVFVGIDHGGSTLTALVVDDTGQIRGRGSMPLHRHTPHPGWVEHDPTEFVSGSLGAAHAALVQAGLRWRDVDAVGISNQGETSIAWDGRTGTPVAPALSWQDKRTGERCDALIAAGRNEQVTAISGLSIDPYFSASKFGYLADTEPAARSVRASGDLRLGGTDSYLIDRLTAGQCHLTDPSTASRTALMDLDARAWSPELVELFGVPYDSLPSLQPTAAPFGVINHPDVDATGIPIAADIVDAHSALFLHELWSPSSIKATFGTGAFVETSVGSRALRPTTGLTPFVGWVIGEDVRYVLEGSVFDVGSAIDWLVDIGLVSSAADTAAAAMRVADTAGTTFIPAFTGLAAPHWDSTVRAQISGLNLRARGDHLVRALLEGVARSVAEVVLMLAEAADRDGVALRADGGPSRNPVLMQMLADAVGMPLDVSDEPDVCALGAAALAAVSVGSMTTADLLTLEPPLTRYQPTTTPGERQRRRQQWQERATELADSRHAHDIAAAEPPSPTGSQP